jgi:hypothetical protein
MKAFWFAPSKDYIGLVEALGLAAFQDYSFPSLDFETFVPRQDQARR